MASTAEIAKPRSSRPPQIKRCLKLLTGDLASFFFALGFLGRVGGFNSGLTSDLSFGLAFTGLSKLIGSFIVINNKA